jgi:hypothetical protein
MALTKNDILKHKLKTETIDIPEWGGRVIVSEMSGKARDNFVLAHAKMTREQDDKNITALYAAYTLVDENGELLFCVDDVEELGKRSGSALDRIFDVAERLNHIFTDVGADAKKS